MLRHTSICLRPAVAALVLAACQGPRPEGTVGEGAQSLIMDQLHNGGTEGFLFLPPMVPRPGKLGDIIPDLPVTVRIDEIRDDGSTVRSLATFTRDSGPRREHLRFHIENGKADKDDDDGDGDPTGYYLARWKTADQNLSVSAHYRARVLLPARGGGQRELGFADVDVVRTEKQFRSVDTMEYTPLLNGETLRIKFRVDRPAVDADGDGVFDWEDNCPGTANKDQLDTQKNGIGDACRCDKVVCPGADACHGKSTCSGKTGACDRPVLPDGTSCPAAEASAVCKAGVCAIVACKGARADCNGRFDDGCETAIDTTRDCGACGVSCAGKGDGTGAPACVRGACGVACIRGRGNCDGVDGNLCEVDLTRDPNNCGGCGVVCPNFTTCESGACTVAVCLPQAGNCDGNDQNGCEVNLATDVNHCGSCATPCALPQATPVCRGGLCEIGSCGKGWADCNKFSVDGCEVDLLTSTAHCGACLSACTFPNGVPACQGGRCELLACSDGWADCNKFSVDGCEIDLTSDVAHCGACLNPCVLPHAAPVCSRGQCQVGACDAGFANCDGSDGSGCEVDTTVDVNNCGGCSIVCPSGPNGQATCVRGVCTLTCDPGHGDCDGRADTGCEADLLASVGSCGGCNTRCGNGQACIAGACTIANCAAGTGDCNHDAQDACEAQLATDVNHCGGCGLACAFANAFAACEGGVCGFSVCQGGYADCDGATKNGCEANVDSDSANCGGCGVACAPGASCRSGVCQQPQFGELDVSSTNGDDEIVSIRADGVNADVIEAITFEIVGARPASMPMTRDSASDGGGNPANAYSMWSVRIDLDKFTDGSGIVTVQMKPSCCHPMILRNKKYPR